MTSAPYQPRIPLIIAWSALLSVCAADAGGQAPVPQQAPAQSESLAGFGPDVLQRQLAATVPPRWRLAELTIDAQINAGTIVEPLMQTRFTAKIGLAADTYV